MTNTQLEVAGPSDVAALVTIDPTTYVAAAYAPFGTRLAEAVAKAEKVEYAITTTAGMETAKSMRALFRDIRIGAEKKRAELKAPILEIGKLLDARSKEIEALVTPHETRFDTDIKAEEKRKDDEKAEKIRIEAERQARLQTAIDKIKDTPLRAIALNAAGTQALIDELRLVEPNAEHFEDRFVEAEIVLNGAIAQLEQMVVGKRAQEQLAEQQEAQRQEQTRIDSIKARIQGIKNYIVKGAECSTAKQIEALQAEVYDITVPHELFAEFTDEAAAALLTVNAALKRQLAGMLLAEQAEADAQAERDAQAAKAQQQTTEQNAQGADAPHKLDTGDGGAAPLNPAPAVVAPIQTQYFYGTEPEVMELVHTIAVAYKVDEPVALGWLQKADFGRIDMKKKAA